MIFFFTFHEMHSKYQVPCHFQRINVLDAYLQADDGADSSGSDKAHQYTFAHQSTA